MRSRIVNMTVPEELLKAVDQVAKEEGRTRAELFREAVRRYIEERRYFKKQASPLLTRLANLAVKGPKLFAFDIDRVLYKKGTR